MNPSTTTKATRLKVGLFTLGALLLIAASTVYVNDRPYWWRPCQLVHIAVEDATGLKTKSPIRSMGIEIGYLDSVALEETKVSLGICITAPVEIMPATRAYLRSEGFLGDKFVELKPVRYTGKRPEYRSAPVTPTSAWDWLIPEAQAEETAFAADPPPKRTAKEVPVGKEGEDVQHLVNRVDDLVNEMTGLTNNLKQAIHPDELRATMKQLNATLANASRTLSPEGGLNQTAQRTLAKLEDAIEQLRDQMTRVNKGEGSLGMILNDPSYAEEMRKAIQNVNQLLTKVGNVRFVVDVGGERLTAYDNGRGWFRLGIWPKTDRYYLLGISIDPRGGLTESTTTTTSAGVTTVVTTKTVDKTKLLLTGMLGKVFWRRLDLAIGALNGDGTLSTGLRLGPPGLEERIEIRDDIYTRGSGSDNNVDNRIALIVRTPFNVYFRGGLESINKVSGSLPFFYGAGVQFDDEDIKLLFTLR